MDQYTDVSYEISKTITERYSTSFSMSSRLFSKRIRPHVYAIYGLVRIADEIVDSYRGQDAETQLGKLRKQTIEACSLGYSSNPIVHAFAITAHQFAIKTELIDPFFDSMAMDLRPTAFDKPTYERYIYGSAEVVGLMCLKVFMENDDAAYEKHKPAARKLGAAYQKINFLRDIAYDAEHLGRVYFPGVGYESFDDAAKKEIVRDIQSDMDVAAKAIAYLPNFARRAVRASYLYYDALFQKIIGLSAETIKHERIRITNWRKLGLLLKAKVGL